MALAGRLGAASSLLSGIAAVALAIRQRDLERKLAEQRRDQKAEEEKRLNQQRRRLVEENERKEAMEPGVRMLRLLAQFDEWVYRRVEAVDFRDDTTVLRKVSVDFRLLPDAPRRTLQDGSVVRLIPLTWVKKRRLKNFDIRDEDGRAVSLVRTTDRDDLISKGLTAFAETVLDEPRLASDVARDIEDIVGGLREDSMNLLNEWMNAGPGTTRYRLLSEPVFSVLLRRAAHNTVLVVALKDQPGAHRILKYCYEERVTFGRPEAGSGRRRSGRLRDGMEAALGFDPRRARFSAPAIQDAQSYHFEVAAPPGVDITEAVLFGGRQYERSDSVYDWEPGGEPRVHLVVRGVSPGSRGRAQVSLRPSRHEFRQVLFAAGLVAVVLLLGTAWVWTSFSREIEPPAVGRQQTPSPGVPSAQASRGSSLERSLDPTTQASHDSKATAAATLLVVLPAVFATLLVRPAEHAMASTLLSSGRTFVIISSALAYGAAATLVVVSSGRTLRVWWAGFTAVAVLLSCLVALNYVSMLHRKSPPAPRSNEGRVADED
jgi:hypothetical protein